MTTNITAMTLATLIGAATPAYGAVPIRPEPAVGAQVQIIQNGNLVPPRQPALYEAGSPLTIEYRVDAFAFERYSNTQHPVAGHQLTACIYHADALSATDKVLSPDERVVCHTLPATTFMAGPKPINSADLSRGELNPNQIEYSHAVFIDPRTNLGPKLPVGTYYIVTGGEIDGNAVGRDRIYAATFKVLDAASKPIEVKNIFADRGMELAYARHEPRPGTRITLESGTPGAVPVLFVPNKWDLKFLPTLEEWEVKGMGYREEYLLMDGIVNTNVRGVGGGTDMIERALSGAIDREDPRIVHYVPGQSQEFHFVGEFPASGWNKFWRGGDAGVSKANVVPNPTMKTQPTNLAQIIEMTQVDQHGRPEWDNVGTLMHVAYDKENHIIGWQQAYIVTSPQVNSAAAPFIVGILVGAGGMALVDYLLPPIPIGPGGNGGGSGSTGSGGFGAPGSPIQ